MDEATSDTTTDAVTDAVAPATDTLVPEAHAAQTDAVTGTPTENALPSAPEVSDSTPFADAPVTETPTPQVSSGEGEPTSGTRAQDSLRSFLGPNEWTAPVKEAERVVEKVVEKEVIKEVVVEKLVDRIIEKPVDRVVEKIVYKDKDLSKDDLDKIIHVYLINLSKQGTVKKHKLMEAKLVAILDLISTKTIIMHKDVMDALDVSSTTATRLLHHLCEEGKLKLHTTNPSHPGGNSAHYTKP